MTLNLPCAFALVAVCATLRLATGCGKTEVQPADAQAPRANLVGPAAATGCIQGVVINGLTGERVALPAADADTGYGIQVRVRDHLLGAVDLADAHAKNAAMAGEYSLCDVPLEDDFPLYVNVDGFAAYESVIAVPSSVAERSGRADADIEKPLPTRIYNIRLFPVGAQTQDLAVKVLYGSAPVKGATVLLTPSNTNFISSGDFLPPTNGELMALAAVAGDDGVATFPAPKLVLGGVYDYTVMPPAGQPLTAVHVDHGITLGLLAAKLDHAAYLLAVNLDDTAPLLKVVSQSLEPSAAGTKTCTLNRPVVLAAGTLPGVTATLGNPKNATLATAAAASDVSASAKVSISADGLTVTLAPIWDKSPDLKTETNLTVTYAGVVLEPASGQGLAARLNLADQCTMTVGIQ